MFDWFTSSSRLHKLKVLALSPHTDDYELGAGGLISRLIESGAIVTGIAFSTCNERVPSDYPDDILEAETTAAAEILGITDSGGLVIFKYPVDRLAEHRGEILDYLVKLRNATRPDLVLIPCASDIHQDHQVIHGEAVRAFKSTTVLGYQMAWNCINFVKHQVVVKLTQAHIDKKMAALSAYQSQGRRAYMRSDFLWSWARANGVLVGAEFAETFECVRWVVG